MNQNIEQNEFTGLEQELWDIAEKTVAEYKERPKRILSESEEEQIAELRAQSIDMPRASITVAIPTYWGYGMARCHTIVKIPL